MTAVHVHRAPEEGNDGFFGSLFEVFTPRRVCMNLEPDVIWLHVISDALIALSYFSIPIALVYFVRRRKDLEFHWMFLLFAGFILACGTTHVIGIWDIWQPLYRVDGLVKAATGVISMATAILLWPLIPRALALPSPLQLRLANAELQREVLERKAAQEELRRASEELEHRVQERTAELRTIAEERNALLTSERAARRSAEQANRVKDEFVATLSHELRTPISAILGWSHQLRTAAPQGDLAHGLEVIERNTRAQARMIDDLLDMSRIVAGKLRLEVHAVDLPAVIGAALDSLRPAAEARSIRLVQVLDPDAGPIKGDPNRLQQVVWNLLSNAIKFTPKGGRVQVTLARVASHVEITVHDTGKGIGAEFLPQVFDRFRQEDASISRSHAGLGIGLAIVKHLVELHGGSVRAESEGEGKGATFTVTLPLVPLVPPERGEFRPERRRPTAPAAGESASNASFDLPSLAGLRVLLVEDDADSRAIVQRVLEAAGASVRAEESAAAALAALDRDPADVIVSDIGMPEQNGYQFMQAVRKRPPARGGRIPAVALTAFARTEDRTQALLAGYQAHVAKPAEPAELITTIASIAGRMRPG